MTPFIVDFSSPGLFFFVITEQGVEKLPLLKLFSSGTPNLNYNGRGTVVLRFLKIITPVECVMATYVAQEEGFIGELLEILLNRIGQCGVSI